MFNQNCFQESVIEYHVDNLSDQGQDEQQGKNKCMRQNTGEERDCATETNRGIGRRP